jgi:hypothetical protein
MKKVTVHSRKELEDTFEKMYVGKLIRLNYPGQPEVVGILSRLAIDRDIVIISINYIRYEISVESFQDCITIIKK